MADLKEKSYAAAGDVPVYEVDQPVSIDEPQVGELHPGEAEAGGLGRHLGLWSTVCLMCVQTRPPFCTSIQ
jgi:hypothetical protein